MRTNYHTHTARCKHATGTDEEIVLSAIKGGYEELGFSDNCPWQYRTNSHEEGRMTLEEFPQYVADIRALQEKYKDKIKISLGLECEYYPEYMHWLHELLKKYKIDYAILGNHYFHTDEKFPFFGTATTSQDMLDLYEESTIEGMGNGIYSFVAHPDLFLCSYPEFDRHCKLASRHICRKAAQLNIPLEYNVGPTDILPRPYPFPEFWKIAASEGCTAIIGIDAHSPHDLEDSAKYIKAEADLKEIGIKTVDKIKYLNEIWKL